MHILKNLPGITASDSRSYRIEALRVHLENQLGDATFLAAYKIMTNLGQNDDLPKNEIETIFGGDKKKLKFLNLITQLIVCEDSYYGVGQ